MGLFLRLNLFYLRDHKSVYGVLSSFYKSMGRSLEDSGDEFYRLDLYEYDSSWTLLSLDSGWDEWSLRREACKHVSKVLNCTAFSLFVYDGDYWAYEMNHAGNPVDYFVQDSDEGSGWFPGEAGLGNAAVVASHLTYLNEYDVAPYLVRFPHYEAEPLRLSKEAMLERAAFYHSLDIPPREGDEFNRFDECSALNFLRLLGIRVELQTPPGEKWGHVTFLAPVWRSFWIQGRQHRSYSTR